jgi:hypothetical protein
VPQLTRSGRPGGTVFDLLGRTENDLTYGLGWTIVNVLRDMIYAHIVRSFATPMSGAPSGKRVLGCENAGDSSR